MVSNLLFHIDLVCTLLGVVRDLVGSGSRDLDGSFKEATLTMTREVCQGQDGKIYILGSNEFPIRIVDLKAGTVTTLLGSNGLPALRKSQLIDLGQASMASNTCPDGSIWFGIWFGDEEEHTPF